MDLELIVAMSIVNPKNLSESIRLNNNVVPDDEFDGDGPDALSDGWARVGGGASG